MLYEVITIGANFIRLLLARFDDCSLVNLDKLTYAGNPENLKDIEEDPRYLFVKGDICDRSLIEKLFVEHRFETVIHFAAESHVDRSITGPSSFIQTNIVSYNFV